jgi:uncharacterized membrane protein YecN with MAPEG domain
MPLAITALYAALLALVGVVLDGGHRSLIEANRRHMNFVEQVPLLLILLALVELNGGSSTWVHTLGGTLLVARLVHPFGIDATNMKRIPRFIGALLTILVALALIVTLLWQHFA